MSNQASYGIAITADDKTAKGVRSAERRIGGIPGRVSSVNRRALAEDRRRLGQHTRSIVRTFGEVERAGSQIFGGRSLTAGMAGRLGAVRQAAAAAGTGLGEAASSSSLLGSALGTVGVVAGATVGLLAAAAYSAVSFAGNWAKGAADIGRTAATIGVATRALQQFEAASQRAGLEKGVGTGALGGLSETLNDARYGRNMGAAATLGRMGVAMKTKADGTVDVEGMLPAIADAIARQNSSGKRLAATNLGIPLGALAVFAQGGKALGADMRDADKHAAVLSDSDIATGTRINRKGVMVGQMKDRALAVAGAGTAGAIEGGYDLALSGGQALTNGSKSFGNVVRDTFRPAAVKIDRAADKMVSATRAGGIGMTRHAIAAAHAAERKYGVPASIQLAQYQLESGAGRHMPAGSNNPFGIKARRGEPSVTAMTTEVIRGRRVRVPARFRKYGSLEEAFEAHARLLATGRAMAPARRHGYNIGRYAEELGHGSRSDPRYATDPEYGAKMRGIIRQGRLQRYDHGGGAIPVKVEVDLKGAPTGTRVKVQAGSGSRPAVSHAYQPVHGG